MITSGQFASHLTAGVLADMQVGLKAYSDWVSQMFVRGAPVGLGGLYNLIATNRTSNKRSETWTVQGRPPAIKERDGSSEDGLAKEYSLTVTNKDWMGSVKVNEYTLDDDQTGTIKDQAVMLGWNWAFHKDDYCLTKLTDNNFVTSLDGVATFSASHLDGGSNAADNVDTVSLTEANFKAGFSKMSQYKDFDGKQVMGAQPTVLMVGEDLRFTGWDIVANTLKLAVAGSGEAGPTQNAIGVYNMALVVVPFRISVDAWYLFDASKPWKALTFQDRMKPTLSTNANNPDDFERREHKRISWVMDARYEIGGGWWQFAYKSEP